MAIFSNVCIVKVPVPQKKIGIIQSRVPTPTHEESWEDHAQTQIFISQQKRTPQIAKTSFPNGRFIAYHIAAGRHGPYKHELVRIGAVLSPMLPGKSPQM